MYANIYHLYRDICIEAEQRCRLLRFATGSSRPPPGARLGTMGKRGEKWWKTRENLRKPEKNQEKLGKPRRKPRKTGKT